jgi:hypothetical protein
LFGVPVRAVLLPATPLLVPGAAGSADPVAGVRTAVLDALGELLDDASDGALAVLAHRSGPARRTRGPRPSLAGAGVPESWTPDLRAWDDATTPHTVQVPASVALVCLAAALAARGARGRAADVVVHEVPSTLARAGDDAARVAADLRGAAGVVVAGGGAPGAVAAAPDELAPGVAAVLADLGPRWEPEERTIAVEGDHLPPRYTVTLLRDR